MKNNSYIYSLFRLKEKIFGRKSEIRKEAATFVTSNKDGIITIRREFYTCEARLVFIECIIREFLRDLYNSLDQNVDMQLGAIALDSANTGTTTSTTPLTFSHTCTGSNLYLKVGVGNQATSPTISTPTYNSVNMTLEGSQRTNSTHMAAMYNMTGPATGSNTVSIAFGGTSPFVNAAAVSYSGVNQSGQPDAVNGSTGAGSPSVAITTIADNCWVSCVICATSVSGGSMTSRGGVLTLTGTNQMEYQDNNAAKHPAGSVTFAWSAGTSTWAAQGGSFSPATAVAAIVIKDLLGHGLIPFPR